MGHCTYKFPFEKNMVVIPVVDFSSSSQEYGHLTKWRFRMEGPKAEK